MSEGKSGGTALSHFKLTAIFEYDRMIYSYLRLIVMRNLPLSLIEDREFGSVSRYEQPTSRRIFVEVIFALVELVKKRIAHGMPNVSGALMYDGWSDTGTH